LSREASILCVHRITYLGSFATLFLFSSISDPSTFGVLLVSDIFLAIFWTYIRLRLLDREVKGYQNPLLKLCPSACHARARGFEVPALSPSGMAMSGNSWSASPFPVTPGTPPVQPTAEPPQLELNQVHLSPPIRPFSELQVASNLSIILVNDVPQSKEESSGKTSGEGISKATFGKESPEDTSGKENPKDTSGMESPQVTSRKESSNGKRTSTLRLSVMETRPKSSSLVEKDSHRFTLLLLSLNLHADVVCPVMYVVAFSVMYWGYNQSAYYVMDNITTSQYVQSVTYAAIQFVANLIVQLCANWICLFYEVDLLDMTYEFFRKRKSPLLSLTGHQFILIVVTTIKLYGISFPDFF